MTAVSGCLMITFSYFPFEFTGFRCQAEEKTEMVEGEFTMSEILLKHTVVINNEINTSKAMRILKKAENTCLISHSIQKKIAMEITIGVKPI